MDLLQEKPKNLFYKYFFAAFGSALLASIYAMVDMAMVGHYHGPIGSAALAVVAPVWNLIYSLGILTGLGASVLFSNARGRGRADADEYFTASVLLTAVITGLCWLGVNLFDRPLLTLFGADETTLPLALRYLRFVKLAAPSFPISHMLAAFLRNDGAPVKATLAIVLSGVVNIFGDWFFVFALDMGAEGAGLATAISSVTSNLIMLTHFLSKKCTLRLARPRRLLSKCGEILATGFSSFFVDIAMGILTMIFNRQIMRYLGTDALAVYSVLVNLSTLVQCCAYSIGQAAQPIISVNYGAGRIGRVSETLRWATLTALAFGLFWLAAILLLPTQFIRLYMQPSESVLAIAPFIMRAYGLSFLILPFNIFATYYFQAVLKPGTALVLSVGRGLVVSGALLYLAPAAAGADALWFVMLITEAVTAICAVLAMRRDSGRRTVEAISSRTS